MIGPLENHHALATAIRSRQPHRRFHGLGSRIRQERLLGKVTGHQGVEALGHLHIEFVAAHNGAHVNQLFGLLRHGFAHAFGAMAHRQHTDSACEIDETISIHIFNSGTLAPLDGEARQFGRTLGSCRFPARHDFPAFRPGDLRDKSNRCLTHWNLLFRIHTLYWGARAHVRLQLGRAVKSSSRGSNRV